MSENISKSGKNFLLKQSKTLLSNDDFFAQHHLPVTEEFENFLESDNKYFLFQGSAGAGKSLLVQALKSKLPDETIALYFECNSVCSVDDFLLSLNKQLKDNVEKLGNLKINITTNDFREKIRQFIKNIKNNIVIFVDSFDQISYSQNRNDISNLVEYLTSMNNIKACFEIRKIDNLLFDGKKMQTV